MCLNFLDELLTWIRKKVVKDDPRLVNGCTARECCGCMLRSYIHVGVSKKLACVESMKMCVLGGERIGLIKD